MQEVDSTESSRRKRYIFLGQFVVLIIALLIVLTSFQPHTRPPAVINGYVLTPQAFVVINLTDTQSVPTPVNFDQMIDVNWSSYREYLNQNLDNVAFFNSTTFTVNDELYAWMENNATSSSVSGIVWVNLSDNIIPAFGTIQIYMLFLSKNDTWSGYLGEAPTLSGTYGSHDNGQRVFMLYDNFKGRALNRTKWQVINSGGGTYNVDDGLTVTTNSLVADMRLVSQVRFTGIVDAEIVNQNFASFRGTGIELATILPTTANFGFVEGYRFYGSDNHPFGTVGGFIDANIDFNGTTLAQNTTNPGPMPYLMSVDWPWTGYEGWYDSYTYYLSTNDGSITHQPFYVSLYAGADHSNIPYIVFSYVRVRTVPPNNIMPVARVGNHVTNFPIVPNGIIHYLTIKIVNNNTSSTGNPFRKTEYVDSAKYSNFEAYNLSNVEWFSLFGDPMNFTIEHNGTNSATNTTYVVEVPYDLPPHSYVLIYLGFLNLSTSSAPVRVAVNSGPFPGFLPETRTVARDVSQTA